MLSDQFPLEIWRAILVYAVAARGFKRGLRLRLVCSMRAMQTSIEYIMLTQIRTVRS